MSDEITQEAVSRLFSDIHRKIGTNKGGKYIFRGEAQDYDEITSALYRTYERVLEKGKSVEFGEYRLTMDDIKKRIMADATHYTEEKNDDAIWELIQHYGGKTNLIDFSYDYLIALFFACDKYHNDDGRLIVYDKSFIEDAKDTEVRLIKPTNPPARVDAQKSIFVSPKSGVLDVEQENIISIPATCKKLILNFLQTHHNITAHTIYPDIHGYISRHEIQKDADRHLYLGYCCCKTGSYKDAIIEYTKAIEIDPRFATAYCDRGLAHDKLNEHTKAIKDYTEAINIAPRFATAYCGRGVACGKLHEYKKAIADFTTAIELDPQVTEAYYNRGIVHKELHEHENAIEDYTAAININPQFAEAYCGRGVAYVILHEHRKAIEDYTGAININPRFAEAYSNRGNAYGELQEYEKAIADCNKALEINPQMTEAYINRGIAYGKLHEHKQAIADFKTAMEINPQYADAYYNRGVIYGELREHETAIADYTKAIEIDSQNANSYCNRGVSYGKLHEHRKALADFTMAIEINPQMTDAYYNRGVSYGKLHEREKEITDYTMAIEIDPQMTDAYRNRAHCYRELALEEQHEEERRILYENALKDYYAVVKHNPHNIADYLVLFGVHHDFCSRAEGDAEKQRVREIGMPAMHRALELAEKQKDDSLKKKVREYYDEYCVQPPHSTPTEER